MELHSGVRAAVAVLAALTGGGGFMRAFGFGTWDWNRDLDVSCNAPHAFFHDKEAKNQQYYLSAAFGINLIS